MNINNLINVECPQNTFGQNCQHNCSIHCFSSGMCDPVKGYCLGGCRTGWKNAQCDQGQIWHYFCMIMKQLKFAKFMSTYQIYYYLPSECDGRTFGQNCSQSCGKCLNNDQCDPINGSCLNGCDSGYHGTKCKEGINKIMKLSYFKFFFLLFAIDLPALK